MKFIFVNSSPKNEDSCVERAFDEIKNILKSNGHTVTSFYIHVFEDCRNCRNCKNGLSCPLKDANIIDNFMEESETADGIIFGSPVYYGGITSQMKAFLTRLFFSNPKALMFKPIATVVSSRRAGSTTALSEFNLPFLMHSCILVGSQYWNEVHGDTQEDVELDYEGLQCMRTLAQNMMFVADALKNKEYPQHEVKKHLNYISREYKAYINNDKEMKEFHDMVLASYE